MVKREIDQPFLSLEDAQQIDDQTEKQFALRCLAVGCLIKHQIPISDSIIDFLVVNPQRNGTNQGTLVEVTMMPKTDKDKTHISKKKKGKKRKVENKTGQRKQRQVEAMKQSGYKWTILYKENLRKVFL